jgi:hypothetical protein
MSEVGFDDLPEELWLELSTHLDLVSFIPFAVASRKLFKILHRRFQSHYIDINRTVGEYGSITLLQWYYEVGWESLDEFVFGAAKNGHLALLLMFQMKKTDNALNLTYETIQFSYGLSWGPKFSLLVGEAGNFAVYLGLKQYRDTILVDRCVLCGAASTNKLEFIKLIWNKEFESTTEWDEVRKVLTSSKLTSEIAKAAALRGHVDIIDWLITEKAQTFDILSRSLPFMVSPDFALLHKTLNEEAYLRNIKLAERHGMNIGHRFYLENAFESGNFEAIEYLETT